MKVARIARLTAEDIADRDFSFEVSRVIAKPYDHLASGQEIKTTPVPTFRKTYGFDEQDFCRADDSDKALFALTDGQQVMGYAFALKDWNNVALLHTIALDVEVRGQGNGATLFGAVVGWAREIGVAGIRVESQSNNVAACRFYKKLGLRFGGYDELLYMGVQEHKEETALFWYYVL
ncbi:acetyltransferase (GNAT) family protein [Hirsutella rhossiliensis]|uniref:Acetyltransferase (GNAT) family domain-containing protein n=1 Tax=Hirsutella rhossiliensis TaxID=111463 RepID=A0A9P8MU09_9HYPO|nr:acetyltransferase (GNAT) family domain-containing protein [Hirsutella rhossiliensis]KAH0961149.1 acetyltransferase (GNAT) family domain-containing protein [Hirsutella rhossiliensis]